MIPFLSSRFASFRHAFSGFGYVLRTQKNAWIHTIILVLVFILAVWLRLPARDWALILLTGAMVFTTEIINTAIEVVVDLASPSQHPLARAAKDAGAAAVLITAIAAVLIGLLVIGPPLWVQLADLITR